MLLTSASGQISLRLIQSSFCTFLAMSLMSMSEYLDPVRRGSRITLRSNPKLPFESIASDLRFRIRVRS